jgi:hypothetical protein
MKPLWIQALAWLAAVAVALLLAYAGPDAAHDSLYTPGPLMPHGAAAPR